MNVGDIWVAATSKKAVQFPRPFTPRGAIYYFINSLPSTPKNLRAKAWVKSLTEEEATAMLPGLTGEDKMSGIEWVYWDLNRKARVTFHLLDGRKIAFMFDFQSFSFSKTDHSY